MALRIDEQVIRGEIDNCERGRVVGRIWLVGWSDPVVLDLAGNCWRDLAGRKLEFVNPEPKGAVHQALKAEQKGKVGDITASRKVKVPDVPMEEIGEYYAAKKPFPWHWGNSLYLEWFSVLNGRVVIESANFQLNIVGEVAWEMSEKEEESQRLANEQAMVGFMDTLADAVESAEGEEDNDWDASPMSEEEADRMLHRNDILTDRINARLERESIDCDYDRIIKEEIERLSGETKEPNIEWMEEAMDVGEEELSLNMEVFGVEEHALSERARELTLQLFKAKREGQWVPDGAHEEHPAAYLVESVAKAGVKLSGALDDVDWPPCLDNCAMIIARLKRARVYLDDALTALESCREQQLIDFGSIGVVAVEVIDIAKEADSIIEELRARLKEGW
ncbi:hypothetical protein IEN85_22970 [Pelagicoccus sp. NFK12]|uniref:Uncharacterized protein n=1 Tax=Pelagicoccus enzymogenes TaxID=2773457 RepID=A0A927FDJ4_9BACT|nr:hypothetical protein [Pelagicoccus enzymogenes]MBD5782380.1 hypothetical protein [Pelagicoccus enzymogenes]